MRRVWSIYKRELLSLWVTPLAWVLLGAFLLLQGGIFYSIVAHFSTMTDVGLESGPIQAYFGRQSLLLSMTLLLLCPALTMRTLAEERHTGSIEALLTAPVTSTQIVLGKFLAVFSTYVLVWSPTILYALILRDTGAIDWRTVATGYLGVFLVGSSYLGLGVLMSAMSRSQLIALMLSVLVQFGLFIVGIGEYFLDAGPLRDLSAHLSLTTMLEEMSKGLIDTRRVVLHTSLTAWALFVTTRIVDSWRGA